MTTDDAADRVEPPNAAAGVAEDLPKHYFELYALAVEMADRVSARRGTANTFFLAANTGLVALIGTLGARPSVSFAGMALCVAWWLVLASYLELNAAKFSVINTMESRLPVKLFGDEEVAYKSAHKGKRLPRLRKYRGLTSFERTVPLIFAAVYAYEALRSTVN